MPGWRERYPTAQFPIEFKPLDALRDENGYHIHSHPFLERPRQLLLNPSDPEEFDSVPRDYLLVRSPGYTSWQHKLAQKDPHLEIFYSDNVRIPTTNTQKKYHHKTVGHSWFLNRWYLHGITRAHVEKLLLKHFKLQMPLDAESTANHWVPAGVLYNVEVELNVWENRLALLFDENIETSMLPLTKRVDVYGQNFKSKRLGERYLKLWRARWQNKEGDVELPKKGTEDKPQSITPGRIFPQQTEPAPITQKARGRRRRAALRQIRSDSSLLNQASVYGSRQAELPKIPAPVARGRLRRRERRKKISQEKAEKDSAEEPVEVATRNEANRFANEAVSGKLTFGDDSRWRYNSGEIGVENLTNKVPVAMIIDIKDVAESDDDPTDISPSFLDDRFSIRIKNIPQIIIRPLANLCTPNPEPRRYHIISYCNRDPEYEPYPAPDFSLGAGDPVEDTEVEDYEIHVADLIDEAGFITFGDTWPKSFISLIDANPTITQAFGPEENVDPSKPPESSGRDRSEYWHKFSVLLCGYEHPRDIRELPYSVGFGIDHSKPALVYRENRWGYLDVDNVCRESRRPRWRAAWKFEFLGSSEACNCAWSEVTHDLNVCRHLHKDMIEEPNYSIWARSMPDEVLSNVLHFIHQPYETHQGLEDLLHKYNPPYYETANEDESGKSSVVDEKINEHNVETLVPSANPTTSVETSPESGGIVESGPNVQIDGAKSEIDDTVSQKDDKKAAKEKERILAREAGMAKNEQERQSQEVKRTFEMAICSFMGLGVAKDVEKGVELLVRAAERGSLSAKAVLPSLAVAYKIDLQVPKNQLEIWLWEASIHGSRTAIKDLKASSPAKYAELLEVRRFAFEQSYPEVFNYREHVQPSFNLGDVEILSNQLKTIAETATTQSFEAEGKIPISQAPSINAMARKTEWSGANPPEYYVFGSLLHLAALFGFSDAITVLLDFGFDIDAQNTNPSLRTPLLCALNRGHTAIAKLLISRGANCQPLWMYSEDEFFCTTPGPLHYLVNIEDEDDAKDLARILVKAGADITYKCDVDNLKSQTPTDFPVLKGRSITPLRWAVIHQKAKLVKVLLNLGAKFAYEEYLAPSRDETVGSRKQKGCLLLEAPCTDLDILEMFFARARVPGLPTEFSQTPLGLLVSEDDGPERRLRPGFETFDSIKDALVLLLDLQPGFEDILLWSAVRHDHIDIVKYLVEDLGWDIETKWRGLTMLHTAVLYGRTEMVQYLLFEGADPLAVTETRHLTCFHLLMLTKRDPKMDLDIMQCISNRGIDINATESVDASTALHFAIRNQKTELIKRLLRQGADFSIPVTDKLDLLSQGRNGFLENAPHRLLVFTKSLTIIGEVLVQYVQDAFYSLAYVADLLVVFLDSLPQPISANDIVVDKGNGMTVLHLLSLAGAPDAKIRPSRKEWYANRWEEPKPLPRPITAQISLLQLALLRIPPKLINIRDKQGDSPLHYACAAHQLHAILALLDVGADPSLRNSFGLNCVEVLAWSVFFLGGKTVVFNKPWKSWHPTVDLNASFRGRKQKKQKHAMDDLSSAFVIFEELGFNLNKGLKRMALAWDFGRERGENSSFNLNDGEDRKHLEFVPVESAKSIDEEEDSMVDNKGKYVTGWYNNVRRPYVIGKLVGPTKVEVKQEEGREDWDDKWVLMELEKERRAL